MRASCWIACGSALRPAPAGADPKLANVDVLGRSLARGLLVLPGFEERGGPCRKRSGSVVSDQGPVKLVSLQPVERATLAALYAHR